MAVVDKEEVENESVYFKKMNIDHELHELSKAYPELTSLVNTDQDGGSLKMTVEHATQLRDYQDAFNSIHSKLATLTEEAQEKLDRVVGRVGHTEEETFWNEYCMKLNLKYQELQQKKMHIVYILCVQDIYMDIVWQQGV